MQININNQNITLNILDVLGDVVTWKSLIKVRTLSINKVHLEWSRNEVYKKAYNKMLKINNFINN